MDDLERSIRPIVVFSWWIGLNFQRNSSSTRQRFWAALWFSSATFVSFFQVVSFLQKSTVVSSAFGDGRSKTSLIINIFSYLRQAVHWLAAHSSLLLLSRRDWPELMSCFERVESLLVVKNEDRRLTTRISVASVLYTTAMVISRLDLVLRF